MPRKSQEDPFLPPVPSRTRTLGQPLSFPEVELQLSNTDLLSDAVALFRWAVSERKLGRQIMSESASGERKTLLFPRLERVAPDIGLPRVDIKWTERELESLAELVSAGKANLPTDALIRAMRD